MFFTDTTKYSFNLFCTSCSFRFTNSGHIIIWATCICSLFLHLPLKGKFWIFPVASRWPSLLYLQSFRGSFVTLCSPVVEPMTSQIENCHTYQHWAMKKPTYLYYYSFNVMSVLLWLLFTYRIKKVSEVGTYPSVFT